jgi:hypothetical protein
MSDAFLERLSRFTPDGGSLDRDALLFAAGRASVRPQRRWPLVAGLLAVCEAVTLLVLWPRPAMPLSMPLADARPASVEAEPREPPSGTLHDRWSYADSWAAETVEHMTPPEPPWHAFATPPTLLN